MTDFLLGGMLSERLRQISDLQKEDRESKRGGRFRRG